MDYMFSPHQTSQLPPILPVYVWQAPPRFLALPADEVHVWRIRLDAAPDCIKHYYDFLSSDEKGRAARYHFQKDREQYIVARGVLRTILSRYLDMAPDEIRFSYSSNGKPALKNSQGADLINFNMSHSHTLALVGVTRDRKIGIDVERIQNDFSCQEIAGRMFSPQESKTLAELPDDMRHEAFFNCWTRKEAYIKARGLGLSYPLHQFEVSLIPGEPARLIRSTEDSLFDTTPWALQELEPGPGYVGALAVEGKDWQLACWQWPE